MKAKIKTAALTRATIPSFDDVRIVEREAGRWDIVTARLGMPLGPRLLKTQDEDFPEKRHAGFDDLEEAVKLAHFWNDWIDRQNNPKKQRKK